MEVFNVIVGIAGIVGLLVTVGAMWYAVVSSRRASEELKREAAELRHYNNIILRAMESAGMAEIAREDASGKPTGIRFKNAMPMFIAGADPFNPEKPPETEVGRTSQPDLPV